MARVLVLDDDWSVVRILQHQLERDGHETSCCIDALDALAKLERVEFRIIFTDWHMPGFSGLDVLTVVQQKFPRVRRVLVTAAPNEPEVREALRDGLVDALLEKPWGRMDLWRVMQGL